MKSLKILAVAVAAVCFFETANAQVVVRARIGTPPPRHRVVVVQHPVQRRVVVTRSYHRPYRHHYVHHRTVVVRHPHRY
ncbi:MAG: hypothetical protein ABIN91_19640 [Mucilaginibacter sp.]|uniref:hypothetical protein n=1 Tax=Mucilaginibacter sp. TaxID=1882438 RepID=UPI0032630B07